MPPYLAYAPADGGTTLDAPEPSDSGTPSECGDGTMEGDEVCDDGNLEPDDGCDPECAIANCFVPVTHDTVQDAVDDDSCETVYVAAGTFVGTTEIGRNVTIVGVDRELTRLTTIERGSVVRVSTDSAARLVDLSIVQGRAQRGGGIHAEGELACERVTFRDNFASGDNPLGGAIYAESSLHLSNCSLDRSELQVDGPRNDAEFGGAAIYALADAHLESTTITRSAVHLFGDVIDVELNGGVVRADDLALRDSLIDASSIDVRTGGDVTVNGGAIYAVGSTMEDSTVQGTEVLSEGFLLYTYGVGVHLANYGRSSQLTRVRILNNNGVAVGRTSTGVGGGLFVGHSATVSHAEIGHNRLLAVSTTQAVGCGLSGGGGMASAQVPHYSPTNSVVVESVTIHDNLVESCVPRGGGFYVDGTGTIRMVNSTVARNRSVQPDWACPPSTTRCRTRVSEGGGIWWAGRSSFANRATVLNTTIAENEAQEGAGLFGTRSMPMTLHHNAWFGNVGDATNQCFLEPSPTVVPDFADVEGSYNAYEDGGCENRKTDLENDMLDVTVGDLVLDDNGGFAHTYLISVEGPFDGTGDPTGCSDAEGDQLASDQRGVDRVGTCDVGATTVGE